jgi:hypothetical protein
MIFGSYLSIHNVRTAGAGSERQNFETKIISYSLGSKMATKNRHMRAAVTVFFKNRQKALWLIAEEGLHLHLIFFAG